MCGLLLKDFYNMGKNIVPAVITAVCVGLLLMVQGNPLMFVVGITLAGGSICATCLRMDEAAGWGKVELIAPVSRNTIVAEKYVLLFFLTVVSLLAGSMVSCVAGIVTGVFDAEKIVLYASVGFSLALISGGLIIFCIFRFGLIKADFFTAICYFIPVGIFIGILILMKKNGAEIMGGELYFGLTVLLPCIAVVLTAVTAGFSMLVYRKKQF